MFFLTEAITQSSAPRRPSKVPVNIAGTVLDIVVVDVAAAVSLEAVVILLWSGWFLPVDLHNVRFLVP